MAMHGWTITQGKEAPRMAERTTLRLGGRVLAELCLTSRVAVPDLAASALHLATSLGGRLAALGAGSNILAGEGDLPLILVRDATPPAVAVVGEEGDRVRLLASGSTRLPVLLGRAAALNLSGLEGLTGIPGSVGGAIAMNAGSYGQCVGDTLTRIMVMDAAGEVKTLGRADVDMAYRHMTIPTITGWFMVLEAEFSLTRVASGTVAAQARERMAQKRRTQPVTAASAGCVFKNPAPGLSAGKLLDEAGFRGKRLGGMAFSSIHANFLVNEGKGTCTDALELLAQAEKAVAARHGLTLEMEVRLWV